MDALEGSGIADAELATQAQAQLHEYNALVARLEGKVRKLTQQFD
jgi:hypothetical protein